MPQNGTNNQIGQSIQGVQNPYLNNTQMPAAQAPQMQTSPENDTFEKKKMQPRVQKLQQHR